MTFAINPNHSLQLRRCQLAACLSVTLLASASLPQGAQAATDTSWIRFRNNPDQRIFPRLPIARVARSPVPAVTTPVTNCNDDGPGSLRGVITAANDSDTIDLTRLTCATITLETGAVKIPVDNLTLSGPGRNLLAIDGNDLDRVFIHPHGGMLALSGLTIQHGYNRATGFHVAGGGCIASAGYVSLDATTVNECYAGGEGSYGGGIYAYSLAMSNSTLSGNVANGVHEAAGTAAFGGGAFTYSMQLVDSTVSGNRAVHHINFGRSSYDIGGAIVAVTGGSIQGSTIDSNYSQQRGGGIAAFNPLSVSNSTFSGNIAASYIGGALLMRWPSTLELDSSTITSNHATGGGGGVWLGAPGTIIQSSVVSGNTAGSGHFANLETNVTTTVTGDHNLIGDSNPGITLPVGTLTGDPLLAPLAFNGGPTRTHALLAGSAAIDAGANPSGVAFDQRGTGYPRSYGAMPDIGAFERQPPPLGPTPVPALSIGWLGLLISCFGAIGGLRRRQINGRVEN
jgi:hypothetical protein